MEDNILRAIRTVRGEQAGWHALPAAEVLACLHTDPERGLSAGEAHGRLARYGRNILREARVRSAWVIFLSQWRNLPVLLLIVASAISLSLGRLVEAAAVLAVILLTVLLGFFTEHRAQRAMEALKRLTVPRAKALRDGTLHEVPAEELVPGDVIEIEAGDWVPADARVVDGAGLLVEESALTGESEGVDKDPDLVAPSEAPLGERRNMVYLGTAVLEGRGTAVVVATGMATEAGHIGELVEEVGDETTPLEKRLAELGRRLIVVVLALATLYVGIGIARSEERGRLLVTGIALAIAAVPEGLPAVATIALALGLRRMARRNALIRRLPAVETLGSVSLICTDKTGTLTLNQMTLREIRMAGRAIAVTGEGYEPHGHFLQNGRLIDPGRDKGLAFLLTAGALCNDAEMKGERLDDLVSWTVVGDPTEGALLVAAAKAGLDPLVLGDEYPRLEEIPFDSRLKRMATMHRMPDGKLLAFAKGAPEVLVAKADRILHEGGERELSPADRECFLRENHEMASKALRILALAYRELPERWTTEDAESGLTLLGLVGIMDPPRPGVKEGIRRCKEAGIRVVMVTGDQLPTAVAVARELDLTAGGLGAMDDRQLSHLNPTALAAAAQRVAVFARVSPEHKLVIVRAFQEDGQIVAMTGDGVNDAPALKQADIGIAMGRRGTDAAREAADMVLADDNFATIVAAVEEGRIIFANIKKFIQYLFACNLSEVATMLIAVVVGLPIPLQPLDILWINLTVNTFPALALAGEPAEPGGMEHPPRHPRESILPAKEQARILGVSLLLALAALGAFLWALSVYGEGRHAETVAFITLAMAQLWLAFSARSTQASVLSLGLATNPYMLGAVVVTGISVLAAVYLPGLEAVLESAALVPHDWMILLAFSLLPIVLVEVAKRLGLRGVA